MADQTPRVEADDEWLTDHRSNLLTRLRHRLRPLGGIATAFSHADTGPYAGAPRNPRLATDDGDKAYSVVRYTTQHVAYTATTTHHDDCQRCGQPLGETHALDYVRGDTHHTVGAARTCPDCQDNTWLLHSRMPTATQARAARRNVV